MTTKWVFQKKDCVNYYAFHEKVFNDLECEAIIKLGEKQIVEQASVGNEKLIKKKNRMGKISWISPSEESIWVFEKVSAYIEKLNKAFFNFDLDGFPEDFQFTKYKKNEFYDWHVDRGYDSNHARKLSFSIQLTKPSKYRGGDLLLRQSPKPDVLKHKEQGTLVAFPSFILHKVTPVTKGERNSLVGWSSGSNFR